MATHAFLRDGGPWQKSKGIPSCSLRVCVKHWGNRPKKTKPKQQMYVKTIHVHKTYAILWRKHGKNMFKLESYKPISRSRHSSLHLWLHMVTKQPPRVCVLLGNGPMSPQIWQEMARCVLFTFISCSQLHQAFLGAPRGAPREMASACFSCHTLGSFTSNSHRSNSRNRKWTNINNM